MFSASQVEKFAIQLLGEPNRALSSKRELRFGAHGSLSIDLVKGVYFDHKKNEGGGVAKLIRREGHVPEEWLERHGFGSGTKPRNKPNGGNDSERTGHWRIVKTWSYTDERGVELFQMARMENGELNKDVGGDHEPRMFSTHCPVPVAQIAKLPDTLSDRSIYIELHRRAPGEKVARLRIGRTPDLNELARKAARWVGDNFELPMRSTIERLIIGNRFW